MSEQNGEPPVGILEEVAAAIRNGPDLQVPKEVVAQLVAIALQTDLGDSLWRGFCLGRNYVGPMRLGINEVDAVAGPTPERR